MPFCFEQLRKEYSENAFFTSDRHCIEYLLAVNLCPLTEYALLIIGGKGIVFTPSELLGQQEQVTEVLYEDYSNIRYKDKRAVILQILDEYQLPAYIDTAFEQQEYADYFRKRGCIVADKSRQVKEAAAIKTDEQIEAVRFCVNLNENAYRNLMGKNTGGETELSLFRHIIESYRHITGYPNEIIYDFLAGEKTGEVSGAPMDYQIKCGDAIIADLLPRHHGVYADMTRTFFAGKVSQQQADTYRIVWEALMKAEELLRPGIRASEIYESVSSIQRKYAPTGDFPHHAGHGLGLGYFDEPYFLKEENQLLKENMIVTLEPGIYYKHEYGIRLENNYLITKNGAECLGRLPLTLEDYILPFAGAIR